MSLLGQKKSIDNLVILTGFALINLLFSIFTMSLSVFFIQFILTFLTIPFILKKEKKTAKLYLIIFAVATLFMYLVYIANLNNYGVPYYIGGSDDLTYEQLGMEVYNANVYSPSKALEDGIIPFWHNSAFQVTFLGLIIKFSSVFDGYNTFNFLIINVYFLIWATMLLEYFLRKYANFTETMLRWFIVIFSLTPNILYINSHVFRDTLNLLQILLMVFAFDRLFSKKYYTSKLWWLLLIPILIYITYYTRANSLVFAVGMCLFILSDKLKLKKRYLVISLILLIPVSGFLDIIDFNKYAENYTSHLLNQADGFSSIVFEQPLIPFGFFLRSAYALITPFPDFFSLFNRGNSVLFDIIWLLIYIGVVLQIIFIPFIIKRIMKLDWLSLNFLLLFLAIVVTTFTFRHIILYYPFMVALAIDGYRKTSINIKYIILIFSLFIGLCLALIYMGLRF